MNKYQLFYVNDRTNAIKPDTKTSKNQLVEKAGKVYPDQSSDATLEFRVC